MKTLTINGVFLGSTFPAFLTSDYEAVINRYLIAHRFRSLVTIYDQDVDIISKSVNELHVNSDVSHIKIPVVAGESFKSLQSFGALLSTLQSARALNPGMAIIIGGGTICNCAGFVASIWKDMQQLVIPTTYTAMCDVAVGSLHMLNSGADKNGLRVYSDPMGIILDSRYINSLLLSERRNGLVETVKHALTQDADTFDELEKSIEDDTIFENQSLFDMAIRTALLKSALLGEDPHGNHTEAILNYGHTIAHMIESANNYSIPHGESVSLGILVELAIYNDVNTELFARVRTMLQNLGLPVKMPQSTGVDQLIDHIKFRRSMGEKYLIPRVDIVGKISPGGGNYRQIAEMAKIIDTLKIIHQ
jgi:3-dehydroquinate synthase